MYFYDFSVFDEIRKLKPSARGKLEISDVNNAFIEKGNGKYLIISGFLSNVGTNESREKCEKHVKQGLEEKILKTIRIQ